MAPHSSTLAWKILWTEEPGRLRSMGSLRVGHDWWDLAAAAEVLVIVCNLATNMWKPKLKIQLHPKSETLGCNVAKHAQDLSTDNYKIVMQEIKDKLSKQILHIHRLEDSVYQRYQFSLNWYTAFMQFLAIFPVDTQDNSKIYIEM